MKVYKYIKEEWIYKKWLSGNIFFSPIQYYRDVEDLSRKDSLENTSRATEEDITTGNATLNLNGHTFKAKEITFRIDDKNLFVSCFSKEFNPSLKDKFGSFVLEIDVKSLTSIIKNLMTNPGLSGILTTINLDAVIYTDDLLYASPFKKRVEFRDEKEFRITVEVRKGLLKYINQDKNHHPAIISSSKSYIKDLTDLKEISEIKKNVG